MKTIKETYVSLDTAKLLKEEGFNISLNSKNWLCCMYDENGGIHWGSYDKNWYFRITHQMAMKWLREAHNIIIEPESVWNGKKWEYQLFVVTPQNAASPYYEHNPYKSYEECVEAGIKYCLEKKLIL